MSQRARSTPAGLPTASLTGEKGLIMKLSVMERLTVQGLLPQEANFTNLKLLRIARENLSFSEKELKILNVREGSEPGTIQWDEGVVSESDIELGETATGMIIDAHRLKTLT